MLIGADVGSSGQPNSYLTGQIDEVRLSHGVRYDEDFEPPARLDADEATILLLHMDDLFGNLTPDCSGNGLHGELRGSARLVPTDPVAGDITDE